MPFLGFELRFHPNERHLPIDFDPHFNVLHPCYCFHGTTTHQGTTYEYKSYKWYYTVNDGIGCCFMFPNKSSMGYHPNDVESVTVLFKDGEPAHVYFHAHSYGQGVWRTWDQCEKSKKGYLVVYVARYSHASYPSKGIFWRVFGFANDVTSDKGICKEYNEFIELSPTQNVWVGNKIITSGMSRSLPTSSNTPLLRFCMPLTSHRILHL